MAFNPKEHMIKLKGKDYLHVAWRLVWFRDEHPTWSLDTDIIEMDDKHAIYKAVICDENGIQKSAGHGSESARDFVDFLEKAETKAVGRALAMLGYGTQFAADELDEGERMVDSPVNLRRNEIPPDVMEQAKRNPLSIPTGNAQMATDEQKRILRGLVNVQQLADCNKSFGDDWSTMTANQCARLISKIQRAQEAS